MRPFLAASGLAVALLLLAAPTATADPVDCTVAFAADQYYDTGDYVFGHGQLKTYASETIENGVMLFYCAGFT